MEEGSTGVGKGSGTSDSVEMDPQSYSVSPKLMINDRFLNRQGDNLIPVIQGRSEDGSMGLVTMDNNESD